MLRCSVLLCTKDRQAEVRTFLASLAEQTRRPDETLVIDGARDTRVAAIAEEFGSRLAVRYISTDGHLTVARNLGVRESQGDVLFFLDDDLVLAPTFIENVMRVFEADSFRAVGGVCGTIEGYKASGGLRRLLNWVLFLPRDGNGSFQRSGAATWPFGLSAARDVEFLPGGLTAYRREVFQTEMFDESLPLFGFTDDVDFSYRVSRRHRNRYEPSAVARHARPPSDRAMRGDILKLWLWAYWRNYHRNRRADIAGYGALILLSIGFVLRFLESQLHRDRGGQVAR